MRAPIGIRIYRSTHERIRVIARELKVPMGEVVDLAIKSLPAAQAELSFGPPAPARTFVRSHMRRVRKTWHSGGKHGASEGAQAG